MSYKITMRLVSNDPSDLVSIRNNFFNDSELLLQGQSVRPNSRFLVQRNTLFIADFSTEKLDNVFENHLIQKLYDLKDVDKEIKRELIISNVSETDQYGFELSKAIVKHLADNSFSIIISGIFL